jgi:hypothetical protein
MRLSAERGPSCLPHSQGWAPWGSQTMMEPSEEPEDGRWPSGYQATLLTQVCPHRTEAFSRLPESNEYESPATGCWAVYPRQNGLCQLTFWSVVHLVADYTFLTVIQNSIAGLLSGS